MNMNGLANCIRNAITQGIIGEEFKYKCYACNHFPTGNHGIVTKYMQYY